jgi:hypothetical protein
MHGVPATLDLRPFEGDYLTQICLGQHDLQLHFCAGGHISIWGHWELREADGRVLDQAVENPADRECYKIHVLLTATVIDSQIDPPRSFTLFFGNGVSFTIFDDSDCYESFSIQPGNIFI